jgi:hypothetical protein
VITLWLAVMGVLMVRQALAWVPVETAAPLERRHTSNLVGGRP